MERGLKVETHDEASVKMLPTYVRSTPEGSGKTSALIIQCFIFIAWLSITYILPFLICDPGPKQKTVIGVHFSKLRFIHHLKAE